MADFTSLLTFNTLTDAENLSGLSEISLERISNFKSLGWLTRFTQHRDSRVRVSTWNLLKSLVSTSLIKQHPTLIDESFETFLQNGEIYGVKIASLMFL
jgi:hypothetical protein